MLFLGLSNIQVFWNALQTVLGVMSPFIIGTVIAFILNGVMETFQYKLYTPLLKNHGRLLRLAKPFALISTYLVLFIGFGLLLGIVLPQIVISVTALADSVPEYVRMFSQWALDLMQNLQLDTEIWKQVNDWLRQLAQIVFNFVPSLFGMIPQLYGIAMSVGGGVFNFAIGLFVSMYILSDKQRLLSQVSRIHHAFMPRRAARAVGTAAKITVKTFRNYVAGQLLDALIIGTISTLGLTLFQFPYAMLIGVVMGVTNVIPFFGPFIGAVPGFFIILMVNPMQALWYILFVVILQQIDGNLIVPRIIGSSIGLPPLWVLFAVTVGGGLFGVLGMVVGMPVFSVFYKLLGQAVRRRERARIVRKCMNNLPDPPAAQ